MSEDLTCPWCHEPARGVNGVLWVCDDTDCPVDSFVREEVPAA